MSLEPLDRAPVLEDFTPLSEYTSQTPTTFFPGAGPAVLHYHVPNTTLKIPREQFLAQADFQRLLSSSSSSRNSNSATSSSGGGGDEGEVQIPDVEIWVTSRNVLLFSPMTKTGLRITYPTITVTAQDGEDVLLELNLSDQDTADEEIEFVQLRISSVGSAAAQREDSDGGANGTTATMSSRSEVSTALFKAISDCQDLNPDPPLPGEEGDGEGEGEGGMGGFDPTAPGATGWITSENMGDFMDEDGNFRMPEGMTVIGGEGEAEQEPLGEGAGRTRRAGELDAGEEDESKWQRTG